MNKKIIGGVIAVIIVLIAATVLVKNNSKQSDVSSHPIKIGAVISLSGFAAPWGEYARNGMNLAVKQINEAGGINGRQVELIIEDDHTDGKDAVSAYTKLISVDHAQGILGGVFDFTGQPLLPLALNNKIPFISASNFRIPGGFELNSQSFVMLPDFSKVIRQLKTYLSFSTVKSVAVVHFKSSFGNEIAKTLDAVVKENGGEGIVNEEYGKIGDNNFRTTIAKLKAQHVDTVFLDMVGNDPVNFLTQSRQLGFAPKFISYNGVLDSFPEGTDKSLLEGVTILNWEISGPRFIEMYKSAYGVEPTKSADKWFDAVYVMAQGIAQSSDSSAVATYIERTKFTTPDDTIMFTSDHAVGDISTAIQVVKDGMVVEWVR